MKTHNPNTRAIVSALRSDLRPLRTTAIEIVDQVIISAREGTSPIKAVMLEFDASWPTAKGIIRERARFSRTGNRRR